MTKEEMRLVRGWFSRPEAIKVDDRLLRELAFDLDRLASRLLVEEALRLLGESREVGVPAIPGSRICVD